MWWPYRCGGSRYESTRAHVLALMRFHSYGRAGVGRALDQLYPAYVMEVGYTRPREVAEAEFVQFSRGAALLVSSSIPDRNTKSYNASREKGNRAGVVTTTSCHGNRLT